MEISSGTWWIVAQEYAEASTSEEVNLVAIELDHLAAGNFTLHELQAALIEVECYYWPNSEESQSEWFSAMASFLRDRIARRDTEKKQGRKDRNPR